MRTAYASKTFLPLSDPGYQPSDTTGIPPETLFAGPAAGAEFDVVRVAPLGDPLEISAPTMTIMLRRRDLALLQLEPLPVSEGSPSA
ncbi:iron transporter [Tatumella ptyseos]|uniref:Ferrous iron transport protein A n=1 Tax=Tatumella ptyseos TaxID=82987 RepID=A0A2X5NNY9_9GAMM|nr:Ferrous iron transport protein A [Tatumella ptyseos]